MALDRERGAEMVGGGAGVSLVFSSRQFLDPIEGGAGFTNWVPQFGALGRPSSVVPGALGLGTGLVSIMGTRGQGPTANDDAMNSALASFGGSSLIGAVMSAVFSAEDQIEASGFVLTTRSQLASRSTQESMSVQIEQEDNESPEESGMQLAGEEEEALML